MEKKEYSMKYSLVRDTLFKSMQQGSITLDQYKILIPELITVLSNTMDLTSTSIINQDKIYVVMGNIMTIDCLVESTPMRHYLDKALAMKFLEDNNKVLYYGDEIAIMKYWIKEEDLYS